MAYSHRTLSVVKYTNVTHTEHSNKDGWRGKEKLCQGWSKWKQCQSREQWLQAAKIINYFMS